MNIAENNSNEFSKLELHPDFEATIKDVNNINIQLPKGGTDNNFTIDTNQNREGFVTSIGDIKKYKLNSLNGQELYNKKLTTAAYDESIFTFNSLEGIAYVTAHTLILSGDEVYIPQTLLTLYFYTRSSKVANSLLYIKITSEPELEAKRDYMKDKIEFLKKTTPVNALLLIDGPLIGGNLYTYMITALKEFEAKNIIPLFFVKNSMSNLVTENITDLKNVYNSDLHWTHNYLDVGERTSYFQYTDRVNPSNTKVFSYIKAYSGSPQRVEMYTGTYNRHKHILDELFDLVYFLLLAQGNCINPQVRPIAVAEKYARDAISMFNVRKIIKQLDVTPTINQGRFG
jgi:hypothetical protein